MYGEEIAWSALQFTDKGEILVVYENGTYTEYPGNDEKARHFTLRVNLAAGETYLFNAYSWENPVTFKVTRDSVPPPTNTIFTTKYEATLLNWILFFVFFGWVWMWF
jgi:predicted porin